VALDDVLETAIAGLGTMIEDSGAVVARPGPLPEVMGDPSLLVMLWQNLIGNGIKFRAPDRPPALRITVSDVPVDGMWQFCVEDNGIGIPPEFADKVFVIFQRLHGRDAYAGTGIGLALCKRIVEHHDGEIGLDVAYADGTRVCFTLPRIDPPAPEPAAEPGREQAAETSGTGTSGTGAASTDAASTSAEGIPA
jgi:light-regulated signal transduction histidine kinase (bacteriophytochrome)